MKHFFSRLEDLWQKGWPYALVAAVSGILAQLIDPISRDDSHYWRMWLAVAGVGFVGLRAVLYWREAAGLFTQLLHGAMVVACVAGVFNYYQFDRDVFTGIGDHTDITYYYLNSKYLDELGYFGLYAAMLQADKEGKDRHASHIKQYRDLRDYEVRSTREAFTHGQQLRDQNFTPDRWLAFQRDSDYFLQRHQRQTLKSNFFVDHGYNPPPTWSIVGGTMANLTPVEYIDWIAQVDTVLVVVMFGTIAWAFGLEAMLFALLFFTCTFSGRWPILGQSLMRFDWVAALVMSVCFLKREKHLPAGMLMAYAALNRIFPAIFFAPWFFAAAADLWRDRKLHPRHLRLIAGAAITSVLLVGGALVDYGPGVFRDSAKNLVMHNESFSSHRVGLGDLLVYDGETTRVQINEIGGMGVKEAEVQSLQPLLKGMGVLALLWVAAYVYRTRRDDWALIGLAVLPFYCITNPQINYYNLRLVLILWSVAMFRERPWHRLLLAALFLTEVATQWTKVENFDRYTTTTTTSICMAIYLALLMGWMAVEMWKGQARVASVPVARREAA